MSHTAAPAGTTNAEWQAKSWWWLGLLVVVGVSFGLVRIAVLNVFFTTGDMRDPGWLASITWHNGWRLRGPPAFPWPYFHEHVAPVLWLSNAVSYVVPLAKFDYYAACIAAIHALYAAGVVIRDARVRSVRSVQFRFRARLQVVE